jgi:hypothetical protein
MDTIGNVLGWLELCGYNISSGMCIVIFDQMNIILVHAVVVIYVALDSEAR